MGCLQESWLQTFQPFCVLCCHGVYDTDKCFIACEEAVASGEKISFQPAFAHMLAEHSVHDTAVSCQAVVGIQKSGRSSRGSEPLQIPCRDGWTYFRPARRYGNCGFLSLSLKMSRMYPPSSIISWAFVFPGSTSMP